VTQRATWSATPAHLSAFYRAPLDDGRRDGRGGLAPKSVRNIHGVLHAALRDAVRWGYLPRNVAVVADLPKGITLETHVWSPSSSGVSLSMSGTTPLYAAWPLFTTTGMRCGEVAGLRWPDGRSIHPERFSRWFEQHARDAGLPKIRLHDVRHSYASAALAAGVPAKVVSERLGHANIAITMDTYSHVLPGLDAQAADTVARLILGDGDQEPTRPR
jgi:integrase